MDLKSFLTHEPRGAAVAVARAMVVHPVMVSQWANGSKPVPVDRAAALERATGGKVRRWDVRPVDWHEHWPELIGTEGAPEVPQTATEARDAA
jgi:DNA-binding transcriptional regulator YdaS (Cro superfamily)